MEEGMFGVRKACSGKDDTQTVLGSLNSRLQAAIAPGSVLSLIVCDQGESFLSSKPQFPLV